MAPKFGWLGPRCPTGVVGLVVLLGCAPTIDNPYPFTVTLHVVDEAGAPISGAWVDLGGDPIRTNTNGEARLRDVLGPTATVVSASGYLPEPIAIDRSDADRPMGVEVRLFAEAGPDGSPRWSMHVGGDAMFGRRYVEPEDGLPRLPALEIDAGAIEITAELARPFAAADLRTVNLETVVGDLPDSALYPAKRFILLTPAAALAGLEALSVDLVMLGNNHTRDYLEVGIQSTLAALDAIDLPYVGVADGAGLDVNPVVIESDRGIRTTVFSFTTVDGNFVNDSYADALEPAPAECGQASPPAECFMFDERSWGYEGPSVSIPVASRRIGPAWQAYAALEATMSAADQAAAWTSIYATYPELQDWVARRGHGGASPWDDLSSAPAIADAAAKTEGVVMVQLHAGFQFQTAASAGVKAIARKSIDAGADIVIAHHPHVLQGLEWYKGKLIVYSLGNFIFDQDFLVTFTSAFLRTVWEGSTLLEARLIPVELVGYRPILATGVAAERTAKTLWEYSVTPAESDRDSESDVRRYFIDPDNDPDNDPDSDPDSQAAHLRVRQHDALILASPPPSEPVVVERAAGSEIAAIDFDGLIHAQAKGADLLLGRELFGWGHLEDALADDVVAPAAQWFMPRGGAYDPVVRLDPNAAEGFGWIEMYRAASFTGDTFARPVARIPLPEHRLYHDQDGVAIPADGEASYTLRLQARLRGAGQPYIRLEFFAFDDTNPTEDPTTLPIGAPLDLPFEVSNDDAWHIVDIDLDPALLWQAGDRANVVLVRVRFAPPTRGDSVFAFDEFAFIEWRPATQMQDHFGDYEFLRSPAGGPNTFTLEGMPLHAD